MRKTVLSIIAFFLCSLAAFADGITFRLSAPPSVVVGQQFQVAYTVNGKARDFRAESFGDLEVLMGPSQSTSMSTQIVNGQVSSETTSTFTFVLMASKDGSYTLPSATAKVDGSNYACSGKSIKVLPEDKNAASQGQGGDASSSQSSSAGQNSGTISNDRVFLRTNVSKSSVYEGEPILATTKFYSQYAVAGFGSEQKFPDPDGFYVQNIEQPADQQLVDEHIDGSNFATYVVKQAIIFPQRTGKLTLPSNRLETILRLPTRRRSQSIFESFFDSYQEVRKVLVSPAATITVRPLPAGAPASFEGFVGALSMDVKLSKSELKTNESVTVTITFSGNGNIKLIKSPTVQFPADFELYDPKVTNNFKASTSGVTGNKVIEYLAIPRYAGDFVIPSIEYTYFDAKSGTYRTMRSSPLSLKVEKGSGEPSSAGAAVNNFTNKEDVRYLGSDIRFIRVGSLNLRPQSVSFFGSTLYYMLYLLPLVLFIVLGFVYRKRAIENANLALQRTKKANKVAVKRLKTAAQYMANNRTEAFYDELLKALWGYLSDKLSLPLSVLNKDNVATELAKYGASDAVVEEFISMLNTCEYARYAPVNEEDAMSNLYGKAVNAINQMEQLIKKS